MTLEERIKEIEEIANQKVAKNPTYRGSITRRNDAHIAKKAISIIQELQIKNKELTRLEVIDESGRVYINNNCKMELSYQDEGRTLKIFVNKRDLTSTNKEIDKLSK